MRRINFTMITSAVVLSCLLLLSRDAIAQSAETRLVASGLPSSIPQMPLLMSIAEAEAEGATFPRSTPDPLRTRMFSAHPVAAERTCAVVQPRGGTLRAGDFLIGIAPTRVGMKTKVWWIPVHDPTIDRNGLLVRGWRIRPDGPGVDSLRHTNLNFVYQKQGRTPVAMFKPEHEGDAHLLPFDDSVVFPSAGEWLLVSTSGSDWSCLIVRVRSS